MVILQMSWHKIIPTVKAVVINVEDTTDVDDKVQGRSSSAYPLFGKNGEKRIIRITAREVENKK